MMRMYLTAKVPNEGARRLAWVIGTRFGGDVFAFARKACMMPTIIERLIAGEIAPGSMLVLPIIAATRGEVLQDDWRRKPVAWWFDRPASRGAEFQEQEARGGPPRRTARAGEALAPSGASPAPVRVHA